MMKKLNKNLILLLAITASILAGCKKDKVTPEGPKFLEYSLEAASNPGLNSKVSAVINGTDIFIRVPNSIDATVAVPSFSTNDARSIVYVGDKVQQSGVTPVNMSQPVQYRIVTSDGVSTYNLNALKNASILSFGFYKEDNDGVLFKDYEATITGLNITVDLPVDANVTNLVARYTTSAGAEVRVNTQVQQSQVSVQDYTNPVTFAVTDAETTTPENFVVTVGRLTAPQWVQVNTTTFDKTISGLRLAIHPITNEPYIIYGIGSSSAETDTDRKAVVAYFSGNAWNYVGSSTGFSGGRIDLPSIAFDANGVLYAAYKDIESGQDWHNKASVQKFTDGSWSYVGTRGLTPHTVNYLDVAVGQNNIPTIGYVLAAASGGAVSRSTYTMQYKEGEWSGAAIGAITTAYFSRTFKGNDGFVYYAAMDMTSGTASRRPTLYKLVNNSWQLVGTANVAPAETTYGAILIDAVVAEDGTAYLVFQSQATANKLSFVMEYNGSSWSQIGDDISHNATSNAQRDNIALAVHPNGTLYFAYGDVDGVKVTTFNTSTNNWNAPVSLSSVNGDKIDLKISGDGIPYLATTIDSKVAVYKYDIPTN